MTILNFFLNFFLYILLFVYVQGQGNKKSRRLPTAFWLFGVTPISTGHPSN